jgi:hypothetical protein
MACWEPFQKLSDWNAFGWHWKIAVRNSVTGGGDGFAGGGGEGVVVEQLGDAGAVTQRGLEHLEPAIVPGFDARLVRRVAPERIQLRPQLGGEGLGHRAGEHHEAVAAEAAELGGQGGGDGTFGHLLLQLGGPVATVDPQAAEAAERGLLRRLRLHDTPPRPQRPDQTTGGRREQPRGLGTVPEWKTAGFVRQQRYLATHATLHYMLDTEWKACRGPKPDSVEERRA